MADTVVEQGTGTVTEQPQEQRTFTQDELNSIIEGRLRKESAKYGDYEQLKEKASKFDEMQEANKSELQKATEKAEALQKKLDELTKSTELRNIRDKVSAETGVPANLLTAATAEDCKAQAEAIIGFASANKSASYPSVKDGGEVPNITKKQTNGELFGSWLNSQLN